jgi:hypothetical protein
MKQIEQLSSENFDAYWRLSGETELPVRAFSDDRLQDWLAETLHSLNLNPGLLLKILSSARDVINRDLQAIHGTDLEHIQMQIYTPAAGPPVGQTWGFFRTERMEAPLPGSHSINHAIAFYLYPEG